MQFCLDRLLLLAQFRHAAAEFLKPDQVLQITQSAGAPPSSPSALDRDVAHLRVASADWCFGLLAAGDLTPSEANLGPPAVDLGTCRARIGRMLLHSCAALLALCAVMPDLSLAQTTAPTPTAGQSEDKRIFGIIPNYRTSPRPHPYEPLIPKEKFKIASEDAFDGGTVALAVLFAGEAQLTNSTRAFGQGVKGYAQYLGTAYGDLVIGDMMTEAIFPVMLHQDPRYFRRGTGAVWSRLRSAAGQIFWTRTDSGNTQLIIRRSSATQRQWRFRLRIPQ